MTTPVGSTVGSDINEWSKLTTACATAIGTLPMNHAQLLARRAASHRTPATARSIGDQPPTANFRAAADRVVTAWRLTTPAPDGSVVAAMLLAAAQARHDARTEESVRLVWTGPGTETIRAQATSDVLINVINSARHSLVLCTFASRREDRIRAALTAAAGRDVSITLILENADSSNGQYSPAAKDPFAGIHAEILEWPQDQRKSKGGWSPSLHAKFALADDQMLFVTSANLTAYALDKNIEAGVLIAGGSIPTQFRDHLRTLRYNDVLTVVKGGSKS